MAYDRTKEQTIVISKDHHEKLKKLAENDGRKLRKETELMIDDAYSDAFKVNTNNPS